MKMVTKTSVNHDAELKKENQIARHGRVQIWFGLVRWHLEGRYAARWSVEAYRLNHDAVLAMPLKCYDITIPSSFNSESRIMRDAWLAWLPSRVLNLPSSSARRVHFLWLTSRLYETFASHIWRNQSLLTFFRQILEFDCHFSCYLAH